jgi:hypothetical protein
MYELACPACNSPSQYDLNNYLLLCPACSVTFKVDAETNQKDIYSDHYIVANTSNSAQVKGLVLEWLKRLNHSPGGTEAEYFVTNISGISIPFWIVSMEVHTVWKGLVQRQHKTRLDAHPGGDFLMESGQFKRNYRWAISGRTNICESWGMTRLHDPKEPVKVKWDGFPMDSTLSRGQIQDTKTEKTAYETREFFDFKFANGISIMGIQVSEEEALHRAKLHVEQYHLELARLHVDFLIDSRTEVEIAGVQLVHLPFWYASYIYRPKSALRYFYKPKEKHVVIEGFNNGILSGELPIHHQDKLWVNSIVCGIAGIITAFLGIVWHPAFLLVGLFAIVVAGVSAYVASSRESAQESLPSSIHGVAHATV